MCYDLRDRVHPVTLNYKAPSALGKIMGKNAPAELSKEDEEEIEANLTSIFEFLNVNLELLTDHLDESLSLKIVQGVWEKFIKTSELMIVPTLGDDQKDRKPWDDRRLNFFCRYIDAAKYFFSPGEDEGLSREQIEIKPFNQLNLIMKYYQAPKQELQSLYMDMVSKLPSRHTGSPSTIDLKSGSGVHTDFDWILKLLKMRGQEQFVTQQLKERCDGKWVC